MRKFEIDVLETKTNFTSERTLYVILEEFLNLDNSLEISKLHIESTGFRTGRNRHCYRYSSVFFRNKYVFLWRCYRNVYLQKSANFSQKELSKSSIAIFNRWQYFDNFPEVSLFSFSILYIFL